MEVIPEDNPQVTPIENGIDLQETQQSNELSNEAVDKREPSEETTDKSDMDREKVSIDEVPMDTDDGVIENCACDRPCNCRVRLTITVKRVGDHLESVECNKSEETEKRSEQDSCKQEDQDTGIGASVTNNSNEDYDDSGESKDDDTDKESEEKSQTNDQDNHEDGTNQLYESAPLRRNGRVRQKNRYFLDFHCTDLTKSGRGSSKCDYETTSTSTRSSNRKANEPDQDGLFDPPRMLPVKYCRKCQARTPFGDDDGGCQVCLYNSIVDLHIKKASSKSQKGKSKQSQSQGDARSATRKTTTSSSSSSKRKSSKHSGSSKNQSQSNKNTSNKTSSGSNSTLTSSHNITNNNNNNHDSKSDIHLEISTTSIIENDNKTKIRSWDVYDSDEDPQSSRQSPVDGGESVAQHTAATQDTIVSADTSIINNDSNEVKSPSIVDVKSPKLDAWTPDEVAEYILSKGFSQEAELFKTQSVDGISLLLMQRTDFTYGLKIKLGPALKIYDQVCKLKKEYFKAA